MNTQTPAFTGEFFVPGKADARMEADHVERYRFACQFAAGKSVLDIACGIGYSAPMYLEAGAKDYLGVDLNSEVLEAARSSYETEKSKYVVGDITKFDCGRQFDLVSCFETIEHVPVYNEAIANLFKLVKPGGLLLVSSPNRPVTSPSARSLTDKPENPFHTQEFTPVELLEELSAAGFQASLSETYGQRQSQMPSNRFLQAVYKATVGNPKKKASPVVTPLTTRSPRYFLIRATRPE